MTTDQAAGLTGGRSPGGDDDLLAALKAMHADLIKLGCHLGAWQG